MNITVGLWGIPLAITVAFYAWAFITPTERGGDYPFDFMPFIRLSLATIASLLSWLIWSLLT